MYTSRASLYSPYTLNVHDVLPGHIHSQYFHAGLWELPTRIAPGHFLCPEQIYIPAYHRIIVHVFEMYFVAGHSCGSVEKLVSFERAT